MLGELALNKVRSAYGEAGGNAFQVQRTRTNGEEAGIQVGSRMAQVGRVQWGHRWGDWSASRAGEGDPTDQRAHIWMNFLAKQASVELQYLWLACVLLAAS